MSALARLRGVDPAAPVPVRDQPSRAIAVPLPAELRPYARTLVHWRPECEVAVLRDGEATYPAMLEALAAARSTIALETYILAGDATGDRFKAVLMERARAGVTVRVIYDAVGSFGLADEWVAELRAAGCAVLAWNPIAQWRRRFRLSHRDHRKILVVDDEVAFTGGLNIADDYAPAAAGGGGWRDMHCRVTGAIVRDLSRMFRATWLRAGGAPYPPVPASAGLATGRGTSYARLIDNTRRRARAATRRAYLHVLRTARTRVWIENAYFLPDRGLRRAMAAAVARGVDVQVIVPGNSDVRLMEWASLYVLRALARVGVQVRRWRGRMLHAKTCVVDTRWSAIGSYNFDAMSRFYNLEVTVEILDPDVGRELERSFVLDVDASEPFDRESWSKLPWWKRALAWLSYRLHRLL